MARSSIRPSFLPAIPCVVAGIALLFLLVGDGAAQDGSNTTSSTQSAKPNEIPRGKKLILKDGTFQVVREYQRNGDRVRYFSAERGDWEEIPAALKIGRASCRERV